MRACEVTSEMKLKMIHSRKRIQLLFRVSEWKMPSLMNDWRVFSPSMTLTEGLFSRRWPPCWLFFFFSDSATFFCGFTKVGVLSSGRVGCISWIYHTPDSAHITNERRWSINIENHAAFYFELVLETDRLSSCSTGNLPSLIWVRLSLQGEWILCVQIMQYLRFIDYIEHLWKPFTPNALTKCLFFESVLHYLTEFEYLLIISKGGPIVSYNHHMLTTWTEG